jgi:NAD-dependent SIR2 family protein deacetylase
MTKPEPKTFVCTNCGFSFQRGDLDRECSNCFACTGCEIYLCPECKKDIVIKPIGQPRRRTPVKGNDN